MHIIANNRDLIMLAPSSNCNTRANHAIFPNHSSCMNHRCYTSIPEPSTSPNFATGWHCAIKQQILDKINQSWQHGDMMHPQPMCHSVPINQHNLNIYKVQIEPNQMDKSARYSRCCITAVNSTNMTTKNSKPAKSKFLFIHRFFLSCNKK